MLETAFARASFVTIGLTSDEFIATYKKDHKGVRPYLERKYQMLLWLTAKHWEDRCAVLPIHDPYEPAASDTSLHAIMVTSDNRKVGEEINQRRVDKQLAPLELIEVPLIAASDGAPLSSTRIRNGEVNPDGSLVLPTSLRDTLLVPLGQILPTLDPRTIRSHYDGAFVITVGDKTTQTIINAGITPQLAVFDNREVRRPVSYNFRESEVLQAHVWLRLQSGPGYINPEVLTILSEWAVSHIPTVLEITGEEDLLTIPAVLAAPVGAYVLYGQPREGMVEVLVTEERKRYVSKILSQFKRSNP